MSSDLPSGYRWATAQETEAHQRHPLPGMIVVHRTTDSSGTPYTQCEADLALPLHNEPLDDQGNLVGNKYRRL